ncbi:Succinate--CoA ligase [ADP-forming] subunit beta, mitochondrial [Glycine max]|nr:Succinate--CoA ligase [ADP-forming] subunit beta, mitochondrial [Glycine max]
MDVASINPGEQLVVKSQILARGRGLGTFKSGLKGGVHIVKIDQVEDIVYLCEKLSLVNEMYIAITLDRTSVGPLLSVSVVKDNILEAVKVLIGPLNFWEKIII